MVHPRPSAHVVRIPIADLVEPQVLMTPELVASGVHVEVIAGDEILEMLRRRPTFPGDEDDEQAPILLAVKVQGVDVELVDANGDRVALGGGGNEHLHWWTWERYPWRRNGNDHEARPEAATHLEIRVPVSFPPRHDDPLEALRLGIRDLVPERADELLGQFVPALRLVAEPVANNDEIPVGASRLNGSPDLPRDFEWPMWDGPGDTWSGWIPEGPGPLTFLAQIDLADLPRDHQALPLPPDGWLLFFADEDRCSFVAAGEQVAQRVVYVPAGTELVRRRPPVELGPYGQQYSRHPLKAPGATARLRVDEVTVPPSTALEEVARGLEPLPSTELEDLIYAAKDATDFHQMGGWPNTIQQDPLATVQDWFVRDLAASEGAGWGEVAEPDVPWALLLQIVSDDALDMMFGDVGSLYFLAPLTDLRAGEVSRVVLEFQCS